MERNTAITIVLGILVVMSLMQAYQLMNLKAKISETGVTTSSVGTPVATAQQGGSGSTPTSVDQLSSMQGGC